MKDSQFQQLPIIYVCGYASTQQDVESRVSDPFYGFNTGSAHIRIGEKGTPEKFFFESPLIRLMTDYGYRPVFDDRRFKQQIEKLNDPLKSIWIYRFYDVTSESYGSNTSVRLEIEEIADGLKTLIAEVKETTKTKKIYLVAYSMGGLICRSLIQKIYPEVGQKAEDHIDKLFTYGTPHGGISSQIAGGLFEQLTNILEWNNIDDFTPGRMFKYFTPKDKLQSPIQPSQTSDSFDPQSLGGSFPVDRVFSLIGTNSQDYEEGFGISQKLAGPQSDGLVQIEKAYVRGSHRAYIHRTHGGRYGMVNSESGFENLQRFLFGNIKAKISLINAELLNLEDTFYQMEVRFSIRGLPVAIHEQTIANYSPITIELLRKDKSIPLFTAFLMTEKSATDDNTCQYLLHICLHSFSKRRDWLFNHHIENMPIWSDRLLIDTQMIDGKYTAKYSWRSVDPQPQHEFTTDIPLPISGKRELGEQAAIHLDISEWK